VPKITELPVGTTPDGTEKVAGVQAGVTKQLTLAQIMASTQLLDPTLVALAALNSTAGFVVETAADAFSKRSIVAGTGISVANGDGVSANPTISIDQSFAPTWTGAHRFVPSATGFPQPIYTQTSLSGSGSAPTGSTPNLFYIPSDTYAGGAGFVLGVNVAHSFGGSSVTGGRSAIQGYLALNGATNSSNANRNYVGGILNANALTGDGGTNTSSGAKGAIFGGHLWGNAAAGATNLLNVTGGEVNVSVEATASVRYKTGLQIAGLTTDAVAGADVDAMLAFTNQANTIKFADGILFSDFGGYNPLGTSSTLLRSTAASILNGIDLSALTISGFALKSASGKVQLSNSVTSGIASLDIAATQTAPNSSDTSDSTFKLAHTLSASSATNELVTRVLQFSSTNSLTGGGVLSNQRMIDFNPVVSLNATTTALSNIYMEGTNSGTVTTGYGIYINNILGTTKWTIYNNDSSANEYNAGALGVGTTSVGAAGTIIANSNITSNGVFKVSSNQVVGARITGYTAMTGSPDKATAYATGSVTLAQLAGRVAQLQADLTTHGLIGA